MISTPKGARAPDVMKGHIVILEMKVQREEETQEGEHIVPKKIAGKRWTTEKKMRQMSRDTIDMEH